MQGAKRKDIKSFVLKKMERYLPMCIRSQEEAVRVAPAGCFTVYVGPERQRFVIKTECANHPLFKMLLEDAELEYGYSSDGPLRLPCDVHLFCNILAEMDGDEQVSGFVYGACSPFNPARRLGKSHMAKGCASYGLLTPPRLLRANHF